MSHSRANFLRGFPIDLCEEIGGERVGRSGTSWIIWYRALYNGEIGWKDRDRTWS